MNAFKAYDVRGVYNTDFTKEDVYKIGFFLPELLSSTKVVVGRDARASSSEIFAYLCQGIQDAGAEVYDLGLTTTPMVYWACCEYKFQAAVMITASHNPKEYNGLKISSANATPVGYENGLSTLEQWLQDKLIFPKSREERGQHIAFPKYEEYLQFQRQYVPLIKHLKIVMDSSNGMSGLFVRKLFGNTVDYIFEELDGDFSNHSPNPLEAEARWDLERKVIKQKADVGVIFDGDADRVMFVDEKGNFISPDILLGVIAHYYKPSICEPTLLLKDIRSSQSVDLYVKKMGYDVVMYKVGRANATIKLREINGLFGGELAGHYYFRDFNYSDSGLMACSIILSIFDQWVGEGKKISELIGNILQFANSGELNFKLDQKDLAMEAVKDFYLSQESPTGFYDFDGYRIEYPRWWFNIRKSNTEPYLRLIVEAQTQSLLQSKVREIQTIIESYT